MEKLKKDKRLFEIESLRQKLVEFSKKDPAKAARILTAWLNGVAQINKKKKAG